MRWWKDQIPRSWRLTAQLLKRQIQDQQAGMNGVFAQTQDNLPSFTHFLEERQAIRPGKHLDNKLHNLRLGSTAVNRTLIKPGQVFSFWHCLGAPNAERDFKASRNLVNGELIAEAGGGLCQLSGILYLLALKAGLEIMERHHHSKDIYTEAERFCPLGSDATVVYGYKDLRLKNIFSFPLAFKLVVHSQELVAQLTAPAQLPGYTLKFVREQKEDGTSVTTMRANGETEQVIAISYYQ